MRAPMNAAAEVRLLVRGTATISEVAARCGVSAAEVERWRDLYLDGLEDRIGRRRRARQLVTGGLALALGVALTLAGRVAYAQACTAPALFTTLGLRYFCANSPALADDANTNTQQLVTLVQQKLGTLGTNGNISTFDVTANRVFGKYWAPLYTTWDGNQAGAGGAAIANDNMGAQALMLVGNNSAGGTRRIKMYDDITVAGNLSVQGTVVIGNRRCRSVSTACDADGSGNMVFLDRQNVACNSDEMMQSFRLQRCAGNTTIRYDYTCCAF